MANSLRDYALQQGLKLDYDPRTKNVGVGGTQYTPQQLQNMGGALKNGSWQFQDYAQLRPFGTNTQSVTPNSQSNNVTSTTPVPQVKTTEQLMQEMIQAQNAQRSNQLNQAFEQTRSRLMAEQQALAPQYAEQQRALDARDTMARKAMTNDLIQQGLAGSGAQNQQTTAQNVIAQGAMSNLALQRASAESDIQRRLSEAQQARDFGIAGAQAETAQLGLQNQIALSQQNEARQLADRENQMQREIDTLGAYSGDYQAEINRRQNNTDTTDDWLVPYLQQARQSKLANIEQGRIEAEKINYERAVKEREALLKEQERQAALAIKAAELALKQKAATTKAKQTNTSSKTTSTKKDANTLVGAW